MPSLLQSVTDSAEALSAVLVGLSTSKSGRAETQKALEPKNASAELSVSGVSMMKATSDFSRAAVMYAGNSQQKLGATEALSHDTTSTTAMRVEGTEGSSAPTATHLQDLLATVQNDFESLLTTWNSTGATFDNDPHTNWIEETGTGHLPPYIRQIADALLRTGADESHAIATAVNTVKRWARGGTVRANGGPNVLPDTAAKAAAAIAEWEAKRAEAGANAAETTTLASGPVVVSAPESAPDPEPQYTPEQLEVLARAMKLKFQMFRDFTPKQREKAAEDGTAMPGGSFPIKNREDLKNAIQAAGRAKDFEAVKRHIKKRARELDLEKLLPEDWAVDVLMVV